MTVDNPAGLWLLAAIPAIILLWLLRPRRPRLRIPSVMLWPTSLAERRSARPWQRLRNHPLLWLQLVVAALLAIAAARPFVPAEAAEQRVIVLLDASGSMRAHDVLPSRWDAARAAVVDLARGLGPDQKLSVIRADDQPRILVADVRDPGRVESVLAGEHASYGPIDGPTTISLAAGLTPGDLSEWVLVGDGQFPDLPAGTGPPPGTRLRFVPVGSPSAGNVAITGLTLRANGDAFAAQVGIRNAGDLLVSGSVQLWAEGNALVAANEWSVGPHADSYVAWDGVSAGPRWFEARLVGVDPPAANALDTDDIARAVANPTTISEQRALLVSPGNTFLERVIAVEGNVRTFKVPPADWPSLVAQGDAAGYALVVLDRQPLDATTPLPRGSALYVGLGKSSGDEFQPQVIAPVADHPLVRNVDWSEVRIGRARRLPDAELANWQVAVHSDGGPLLLVRTLHEGGADSQPSRVRREALLTFELGESDLPLRPAFPVLMANLLEWLAPRPEGRPQAVAPGGALQVDASPLARSIRVESVLDARIPAQELAPPWPPRTFRPPQPGLYRLIEDTPDGSATSLVVADGFAPSVSDITPREPALFAGQTAQGVDAAQVLRSVGMQLWPWLLVGVLGLGLLEWVVDARGR